MTDRSSQHWYPTAAYLYTLHLDGPALAWGVFAQESATGATGYAGVASLMRRRPGACACWKIPAWMRATHILLGSPITMPWCSYTPTPTHHPMRIPSSSGAFLGASN